MRPRLSQVKTQGSALLISLASPQQKAGPVPSALSILPATPQAHGYWGTLCGAFQGAGVCKGKEQGLRNKVEPDFIP